LKQEKLISLVCQTREINIQTRGINF